ncbi:hypothetical protein CDAR_9751 [Caerostris darwini]|uniref:Uncharacterized protein n=1 Tax=Caerostris darwini TaxID=1538125 RepID=A0AAV4URG7_9ARAC|nr:hypothetical protein CDAR_9751 [Caerostris darwini]
MDIQGKGGCFGLCANSSESIHSPFHPHPENAALEREQKIGTSSANPLHSLHNSPFQQTTTTEEDNGHRRSSTVVSNPLCDSFTTMLSNAKDSFEEEEKGRS